MSCGFPSYQAASHLMKYVESVVNGAWHYGSNPGPGGGRLRQRANRLVIGVVFGVVFGGRLAKALLIISTKMRPHAGIGDANEDADFETGMFASLGGSGLHIVAIAWCGRISAVQQWVGNPTVHY
ncbi:hypothetical protein F5Y05DRAFT_380890 [Hypoxylon sp. FL0543]|nr:hypothetical protein F5Y05DRAFT_380890 [Hypoxylon sp. FL0543]